MLNLEKVSSKCVKKVNNGSRPSFEHILSVTNYHVYMNKSTKSDQFLRLMMYSHNPKERNKVFIWCSMNIDLSSIKKQYIKYSGICSYMYNGSTKTPCKWCKHLLKLIHIDSTLIHTCRLLLFYVHAVSEHTYCGISPTVKRHIGPDGLPNVPQQ